MRIAPTFVIRHSDIRHFGSARGTCAPALVRCGASPYDDGRGCQAEASCAARIGPFLLASCALPYPSIGVGPQVIAVLYQSLLLAQGQAASAGGPLRVPPAHGPAGRHHGPVLFHVASGRRSARSRSCATWCSNLKENDRVVTIGGIYGVVTNVQRDAERVTIRVDESTGTKLQGQHVGHRPRVDRRGTGRRRRAVTSHRPCGFRSACGEPRRNVPKR